MLAITLFLLISPCLYNKATAAASKESAIEPRCLKWDGELPLFVNKLTEQHFVTKDVLDNIVGAHISQRSPVNPSIGEIFEVWGPTHRSLFKVSIGQDRKCSFIGDTISLLATSHKLDLLNQAIYKNAYIHLVGAGIRSISASDDGYKYGFPMGQPIDQRKSADAMLNTHLKMIFVYSGDNRTSSCARLLNIIIKPASVQAEELDNGECSVSSPAKFAVSTTSSNVRLSYEVQWIRSSDLKPVLKRDENWKFRSMFFAIHMTVSLAGLAILWQLVHRTDNRSTFLYNALLNEEEASEDVGWKLVHGDVFRKPSRVNALIVVVSSGSQLLMAASILAILRLVIPFNGTAVSRSFIQLQAAITAAGVISGFLGGRLYKRISSDSRPFFMTLCICILTHTFIFLSVALPKFYGSRLFIPDVTYHVSRFLLLELICLAFMAIGFRRGFKKSTIQLPVETNLIPRLIPPQPSYLNFVAGCLLVGLFPFNTVVSYLRSICGLTWNGMLPGHPVYDMMTLTGFIFACTLSSVVFTYILLQNEDYRWWWKSFVCPACGVAFFAVILTIHYAITQVQLLGLADFAYYTVYSLVMISPISIAAGSIGFLASFLFIRSIYGSMKIS